MVRPAGIPRTASFQPGRASPVQAMRTVAEASAKAGGGCGDLHQLQLVVPGQPTHGRSAIVALAVQGRFAGRVLDVGCGTGENALRLASGWPVSSADNRPLWDAEPLQRPQPGSLACTGSTWHPREPDRTRTSTKRSPNHSSSYRAPFDSSMVTAGSTRPLGIFSMSPSVDCMHSETSPTSQRRCCCCSRRGPRANVTSKG